MQPLAALQETWSSIDADFYNFCILQSIPADQLIQDGSTATVCLVINNDIYVANCGDSPCYTLTNEGVASIITEDHGTHIESEVERIVAEGGTLVTAYHTYIFLVTFILIIIII